MKLKTLWITIISLFICASILGVILYESRELNKNLSSISQSKEELSQSDFESDDRIEKNSTNVDKVDNEDSFNNDINSIESFTDLDFVQKVKKQEKGKLLEIKVENEEGQPVYQIKLQKGTTEWEGIFDANTKKLLNVEQEEEYDSRTVKLSSIHLSPKKVIALAKKKVGGIPISWQLEQGRINDIPIYTIELVKNVSGQLEEIEVQVNSETGKILSIEKELEEIAD